MRFLSRRTEALEGYQLALAFYRDIGDRLGEANTLRIENKVMSKNQYTLLLRLVAKSIKYFLLMLFGFAMAYVIPTVGTLLVNSMVIAVLPTVFVHLGVLLLVLTAIMVMTKNKDTLLCRLVANSIKYFLLMLFGFAMAYVIPTVGTLLVNSMVIAVLPTVFLHLGVLLCCLSVIAILVESLR